MLDYGIGNLHSAQKSLEHEGADARLTADPGLIADADGVVLPGVGAFGACMNALRAAGLDGPTYDAVASGRRVIRSPLRSGKVYISFSTISVVSPTPLIKSDVSSRMGGSIRL